MLLNYPEQKGHILWKWHPTPVLLPGKSHGRRSLVGCSPWGRWKLDTTERLHFHFSLSCTGEGNGNPLQCSCLENPRDGGAWRAAVYGVAQSRRRLKWQQQSSLPQWNRPFCYSETPAHWLLNLWIQLANTHWESTLHKTLRTSWGFRTHSCYLGHYS